MSPYFHIMPLDKTRIKTRIAINPGLRDNPEAFILTNRIPIRTMKLTRGSHSGRPIWNLTLDLLTYKGIKAKLVMLAGDPLATATIDFNPGVCLYGHNGRILLLTELLDALALLVTHLRPLLSDPADWVDLVPGLRPEGRAYWSYLEVPFQWRDPDGTLLARLRHLRHPSIRTASRHWPDSIEVGGKKAKLQLSIYRKAVEMAGRRKKGKPLLSEEMLAEASDILRLETRMRGEKLVHYFSNGSNVEVIDGEPRLVSFVPWDLIRGHRKCFSEIQGIYSAGEGSGESAPQKQLAPLGRLLARVAGDARTERTFPQLLADIRHYTGASAETIGKIRKAGLAELSRRSPIASEELFSDEAYAKQIGIAAEEAEQRVCHEHIDKDVLRLITKVYRPAEQPFFPHTELPTYHCESDYNQHLQSR